jgi:DNA-binding CsgD family transcriptional regulator
LLPISGADQPAYQAELLRQAATALAERAGQRRLVLLIDNVNLIDDASATLLHQLAATGSAFLLLTLRSRDPAPPAVVALWKDGLVERIEVEGLDGEAIEELLSRVLRGPVDPGAVAWLAARSQGNLLFLRELVLGAAQAGDLVNDAGLWRLAAPPAPSQRLVELVEVRLANLDSEERALLEAVAVGDPLGVAELEALGDTARAESLEAQGLITGQVDGRRLTFRLGHPLYGEVLRAGLPVLRRRAVCRVLAEAVESVGARRSDDVLRVATWRLDSGGANPERLLEAAEAARRAYDVPLAERLARAAASAGAGFPALLLAAQMTGLQGRELEAEAELATLIGNDEDERARLAVARLDNLRFLGRFEEAMVLVGKTEAELAPGPGRDELEARRVGLVFDMEGPAAAVAAAESLRPRVSGAALAWLELMASFALTQLGQLSAAQEAATAGHQAHLEMGAALAWPASALVLACADALVAAGLLAEAEALAAGEYRAALANGLINGQAYGAWELAKIALAQGRVETAVRYGREAGALLRSLGRRSLRADALIPLAWAEALSRQAEAATETLAEIDSLGLPTSCWTYGDLLQARAWTAVATADLPAARTLLEEAADWSERVGSRLGLLCALHDLARLGRAREVEDRLVGVATEVEGELAAARAAHVVALAHGDAGALEQVAATFSSLGTWLLAAEAAADAAVAWRQAGVPKAATAAQRLAQQYAGHCQGAVTPALGSLEVRTVLTPAERETALLAAAGRSNREIASDLGLSVRTVENRIQRVYEKLAISGRAELAAAFGA